MRYSWLSLVPTLAERVYLPAEREPWCQYEYERMDYAFTTLLGRNLR